MSAREEDYELEKLRRTLERRASSEFRIILEDKKLGLKIP